jgi:hypothetical protein
MGKFLMGLVPRNFSRLHVVAIVSFLVLMLYYFRKDINVFFDQFGAYSSAHPELGQGALTVLMVMVVGFLSVMGGYGIYAWKIEPWKDRRHDVKLEQEHIQKIQYELAAGRPQIDLLENSMESFSIMMNREQHPERRIYLLGYGGRNKV